MLRSLSDSLALCDFKLRLWGAQYHHEHLTSPLALVGFHTGSLGVTDTDSISVRLGLGDGESRRDRERTAVTWAEGVQEPGNLNLEINDSERGAYLFHLS